MWPLLQKAWNSPSLTTMASFAARSAGLVLLLPLVLNRFSVAEVNVWQLLSTMALMAALVDFGFTPTFTRIIAFAMGGATDFGTVRTGTSQVGQAERPPNWDGVTRIIQTLGGLYLRMTLALAVIAGVIGTWALHRPVSLLSDPAVGWIAWGVTVVGGLMSFWNGTYISVIQGLNEVAVFRRWEAIASLAALASSAAVLALGGGLIAVAITTQAWAILAVFRNRWLVRSLAGGRIRGIKGVAIDPEILRSAWPRTWRSGVGALVSVGLTQSSGVVFAQFGDPPAVASYLLALRAASLLTQFSQAPFYSRLPLLAMLRARGEEAQLVDASRRGMRLSYILFVVGAVAAAIAAGPLLGLIGSSVQFLPPHSWLILCLGLFFERFGAMHLQLYSTTNDIRWHYAAGGAAILYTASAALAVPFIGLNGFILATVAGNVAFYAPYCARLSYGVLSESPARFERSTSFAPFAALSLALAIAFIPSLFPR